MKLFKCAVRVGPILSPALVFVTSRATVPQTPHELKDNVGLDGVNESIHKFMLLSSGYLLFSAIANVFDGEVRGL